jgi:hypothetical protein
MLVILIVGTSLTYMKDLEETFKLKEDEEDENSEVSQKKLAIY